MNPDHKIAVKIPHGPHAGMVVAIPISELQTDRLFAVPMRSGPDDPPSGFVLYCWSPDDDAVEPSLHFRGYAKPGDDSMMSFDAYLGRRPSSEGFIHDGKTFPATSNN